MTLEEGQFDEDPKQGARKGGGRREVRKGADGGLGGPQAHAACCGMVLRDGVEGAGGSV